MTHALCFSTPHFHANVAEIAEKPSPPPAADWHRKLPFGLPPADYEPLQFSYAADSISSRSGTPLPRILYREDTQNSEFECNAGTHLPDVSNLSGSAQYSRALASLLHGECFPSMEDLVSLVRANRSLKNLEHAKVLYARLCEFGLEHDMMLGNYLVPLFVACQGLSDAHQVFRKMRYPNEYSWSSLVQGYVDAGEPLQSFSLYQDKSVVSSNFMLSALLKACAKLNCIEKGRELFIDIVKQGIDGDLFVGNSLLDMYIKCGLLLEAREVFEKLPVRDVVSWTALISGYVESGFPEEALSCFELMQSEVVPPNIVTYTCSLKACGAVGYINKGLEIHARIVKDGLDMSLQVGNMLIDMYFKLALFEEAVKAFETLSTPDVVSWTTLMNGYVEHGFCEEVLISLKKMQSEGISPNAVTFSCILKACRDMKNVDDGYIVHSQAIEDGWHSNLYVGTTLLDMYAKCGALADAQKVFEKLPDRNTVSWNTLISAFAESGFEEEALKCFLQMRDTGVYQDAVTFIFGLKASASNGSIENGRLIHLELAIDGFENDPFVGSILVDMYAKSGSLDEAWDVFDQLAVRDVVSWTAIIGGCTEWGFHDMALKCFIQMKSEDVLPNSLTYVSLLKACSRVRDAARGVELHLDVLKRGLDVDSLVCYALLDMYCQCGNFPEAQTVFDAIVPKDMAAWNMLITGYVDHEYIEDAFRCFDHMQEEGIFANAVTYICGLKACGIIQNLEKGHEIYTRIVQEELDAETFIGNSLVDMYVKCGSLEEAQDVFDDLLDRDIVSWNILIAGYVDHNLNEEALRCLERMQSKDGIVPNVVTYVSTLKACCNLQDIDRGHRIHAQIAQDGFEDDSFVCTSLMRMYGSLGCLHEVEDVFYGLPVRDVISWTALIAGYAASGYGQDVLNFLQQMQADGVSPNVVTYICSLKGCGGLDAKERVHQLLSDIIKRGYETDTSVAYAVVQAYIKYVSIAEARTLFTKLQIKDEGFWVAMVTADAETCMDRIDTEDTTDLYSTSRGQC